MRCLKNWAKNRGLFHWDSWACPSCRICEVCRRAGDPNKLMYCRRCDDAYHCYCQQPPHKNVGHGPYVCHKHTRCHSCGSTVPGSGPSTRWFLGYTCCDACGRLFVKGNYCPICLKVYRDSETTPMVCCDVCERWVHCACDGISDERYQQFQADQNLQYQCAACRGECYQVKDIDDAVQELWRRKDEFDHELITSLRASAALPSQEDISSVTPDSDNGKCGPVVLKNDYGKSLKFSVKTSKEYGKSMSNNVSPNKNTNKKAYHIKFVTRPEGSYQNSENQKEKRSFDSSSRDQKPNDMMIPYKNHGQESLLSSASRSLENGLKSGVYQSGRNKHGPTKEVGENIVERLSTVKTEVNKVQSLHFKECAAKIASKNEMVKGKKLVIHLGFRSRNVSSSPRSETSSFRKEQDLAAYYGSDDTSQSKTRDHENHMHETHGTIKCNGKGEKLDKVSKVRSSKHEDVEKEVILLRKFSDVQRTSNGNIGEESELSTSCVATPIAVQSVGEAMTRNDSEVVIPKKKRRSVGPSVNSQNDNGHEASRLQFVSGSSFNDTKPLLKLKFRNPYFGQSCSWVPRGEEENPIKGQRSKRKRPSAIEKPNAVIEEDDSSAAQLTHQENPFTEEVMDANWILQKLGKDAVGKRVEVYQSSEKSWDGGVVSDVTIQGYRGMSSSSLLVDLDDGRSTTLELGKQAVRFVSHKQGKRARR
ncbi:uncharacterized protein M6B38_104600 [Iris pallida]|uniref:PHD-type domain-containing protein n=2 Tax=Iris pallida TaxID=29817 RepID=A0AAX6F467_IRIPA|nr:uncharacterized protein M6B38_104600 [Iris pallida]